MSGARQAAVAVLALSLGVAGSAAAQSDFVVPPVPSGQPLELIEAFWDREAGTDPWLRLRFLAPGIAAGGGYDFDAIAEDFEALCVALGLPLAAGAGHPVERIVVSFSDRVLEFGKRDAEATQFFEVFIPEGGVCVWDGF